MARTWDVSRTGNADPLNQVVRRPPLSLVREVASSGAFSKPYEQIDELNAVSLVHTEPLSGSSKRAYSALTHGNDALEATVEHVNQGVLFARKV